MSGIHMKRVEKDCVATLNSTLYKPYIEPLKLLILMQKFLSQQRNNQKLNIQLVLLNHLLVTSKRRMKTNQSYLTGCLKNVVKFYL